VKKHPLLLHGNLEIMFSKEYRYMIIFLVVIAVQNVLSQEGSELIFPKVNHISSNAFYKGTFTVKRPYQNIRGSEYISPAEMAYTFHGFEFRVSIIVRDKGNIPGLPLCVRLTSPRNERRMLTLAEDISSLPKDKILDFNFPVETELMGLFLMELVSPENQTIDADPEKDIVFYTTQISFVK